MRFHLLWYADGKTGSIARKNSREYYQRNRKKIIAKRRQYRKEHKRPRKIRALPTHCRFKGHPLTADNVVVVDGKRNCKICLKARKKAWCKAHPGFDRNARRRYFAKYRDLINARMWAWRNHIPPSQRPRELLEFVAMFNKLKKERREIYGTKDVLKNSFRHERHFSR